MPQIIRQLFEEEFQKQFGVIEAIAVNSGTSALIAALFYVMSKKDTKTTSEPYEVITTPFTHFATINAILIAGAKPVFVDIYDEDEEFPYQINNTKIEEAITKKTKVILPVHLFGKSCDMGNVFTLGVHNNLTVIEDAAQALGNRYEKPLANGPWDTWDTYLGTIGHIGCFSFYKTKNLSTFEGGMITVNRKSAGIDVEKLRAITDQGQIGKYNHEYVGFNFRMAEPCALIGYERLKLGFSTDNPYNDISKGHYPKVVYHQPICKRLGITGNCPVAEKIAEMVRDPYARRRNENAK